jgi:hypothetical protein
MPVTDWLWLAGGGAVTVLVILAVGYWIAQEARERPTPQEPPSPPPDANFP